MKMKAKRDIQVRKCIGTNKRHPKSELLRIVRKNDSIMIDESGQIQGRGAYIKLEANAIKKAQKKNTLAKALRMRVDPKIYDELLELLNVTSVEKENMNE